MKTYEVQVTETINHIYIFEANSSEEALLAYERLDNDQLKTLDHDGMSCWDSKPWDIAICSARITR
jgi:hypothetical protein